MSDNQECIIAPTGTYKINSSSREDERAVKSWGFKHVFTWSDGPYAKLYECGILTNSGNDSNAHYSPHSHSGLTTHLIRRGELTITYPKDDNPTKVTYGVGARLDVAAGKVHEVWMGDEGCSYVIGE